MPDPVTPYLGLTKPTVGADDNTWGGLLNTDMDLIDTGVRNVMPAGAMLAYAGGTIPTGFILCDGKAYSRTTYAALFAAIGSAWGAGDGSTTFNVPDMRDRFPIGAGLTYALGSAGGLGAFTPSISIGAHGIVIAEMPYHDHGWVDHGHNHPMYDPGHGHGVSDPTHTHGYSDPGHGHSISDGGHAHGYTAMQAPWNGANNDVNAGTSGSQYNPTTSASTTGIGINGATTNISIYGAGTGIGVNAAGTGVQTYSQQANISFSGQGSGAGHAHTASSNAVPTIPPYRGVYWMIKT